MIGITFADSNDVALTSSGTNANVYFRVMLTSLKSKIVRSPAVVSWTENLNVMALSYYIKDFTFGAGNWVAIGNDANTSGANGSAFYTTSSQFNAWAATSPITTGDSLVSIAYGTPSGGSAEFVAVTESWRIYTSRDGISWGSALARVNTSTDAPNQIRYDAVTGLFIAVGNKSLIYTSPDLLTWTKGIVSTPGITFNSVTSVM